MHDWLPSGFVLPPSANYRHLLVIADTSSVVAAIFELASATSVVNALNENELGACSRRENCW